MNVVKRMLQTIWPSKTEIVYVKDYDVAQAVSGVRTKVHELNLEIEQLFLKAPNTTISLRVVGGINRSIYLFDSSEDKKIYFSASVTKNF